jgi:hypothetical protein
LPKIDLTPENCIRFELIQEIKHYENNFSPEKLHIKIGSKKQKQKRRIQPEGYVPFFLDIVVMV